MGRDVVMTEAIEDFASSRSRIPPQQWQWWCALFRAYGQMGDVSGALSFALSSISKFEHPERIFLPLGMMLHMDGMHDAAAAIYEKILVRQPNARRTHSELLVHHQFYGLDHNAWAEFRLWNERFVVPLSKERERAATSPVLGRPLRIGFISNDFAGDHSLNTVMLPWFGSKGCRSDTYVLYSNGRGSAPPRQQFRSAADVFIDIKNFSDEDLDARVRQDNIDILVDMISHGEHNRLLTYARKPAPIISSWIGTGIATGIETVDYLFADEILVPRATAARYREKIVYLPRAAMVWCPPRSAPAVGYVPSLTHGHVVFGNLTRIVKFRQETIELWAQVLHRVPESKLMLKDHRLQEINARRILSMFERCSIGPERLIMKQGSSQAEHLAAYNDVDIVLDCFPQNGGVSSLEALWMGVPVISLCHPMKPSGRVGRYILENIGLPALATNTESRFVDLAERLARSPDLLVPLRRNMRQRLGRSPVCDVEAFQRHVEAAFHQMWERYCGDQSPESFTVGSS